MSSSNRKVQRAILEYLKEMPRSYLTYLLTLTKDVYGYDINTDPSMIRRADYKKVSRACIALEKKGYIKSSYIPRIQHPSPYYKSTKIPPPRHVRNYYKKIIWLETDSPNCPSRYFL